MRRPRVRLGSLLAFVAIVACDLAFTLTVIDAGMIGSYSHGEIGPTVFVLGVPLMAGLLVGYFLVMLCGLWRRGESHPFLVGFEVFGWAALFLYLACFVWTDGWSDLVPRYIGGVLSPLNAAAMEETSKALRADHSGLALAAAIVSLPMLIAALFGGMLSSRFRITVVVKAASRLLESECSTTAKRRAAYNGLMCNKQWIRPTDTAEIDVSWMLGPQRLLECSRARSPHLGFFGSGKVL